METNTLTHDYNATIDIWQQTGSLQTLRNTLNKVEEEVTKTHPAYCVSEDPATIYPVDS